MSSSNGMRLCLINPKNPLVSLWEQMNANDRIVAQDFPSDWRYYTLGFPTASYKNFSCAQIVREMEVCDRSFYSRQRILRRVVGSLLRLRHPLLSLVGNLSFRNNTRLNRLACAQRIHRDDPVATSAGRSVLVDSVRHASAYLGRLASRVTANRGHAR